MVAIKVHAGQTDKQGEPYLLHVLRVVEAVSDEAKPVAALHDCLEDGGQEAIRLIGRSTISEWVRDAVVDLSRGEEPYADYIERLSTSGNELAVEVKLADLRDNLGRIPKCRPGFLVHGVGADRWASLKARYEKAIAVLESPA
jgi:hypothetical protein